MRVKITAGGIYGRDGVETPVGTILNLDAEPTGWAGRYEILDGDTEGKTAVTNPKSGKPGKKPDTVTDPTFKAEERDGVFVVVDQDGNTHGNPLSEAGAQAFNALSDADKAEMVKG